jgi:magnesium chelatase family protein
MAPADIRKEGSPYDVKNAREATVVNGLAVFGMAKLSEVIDFFNWVKKFEPVQVDPNEIFSYEGNRYDVDFSEAGGQESVKWALEVAAAGGHNLIPSVKLACFFEEWDSYFFSYTRCYW